MKHLVKVCLIVIGPLFLFGCVIREHNMSLAKEFWQKPKPHVTIAEINLEDKPCLSKTGNQGLLDYAINSAVTKEVDKHLGKTSLTWYYTDLPQKFVTELKRRGIKAIVYDKRFLPKQTKKKGAIVAVAEDKLLLLELQGVGAKREYYGFIPKGAPKAYCNLKGELIDKQGHKVLWRHFVNIEEVVEGNWDQPPHYPNLTKALDLAIKSAQEEIIDSFFSGH